MCIHSFLKNLPSLGFVVRYEPFLSEKHQNILKTTKFFHQKYSLNIFGHKNAEEVTCLLFSLKMNDIFRYFMWSP